MAPQTLPALRSCFRAFRLLCRRQILAAGGTCRGSACGQSSGSVYRRLARSLHANSYPVVRGNLESLTVAFSGISRIGGRHSAGLPKVCRYRLRPHNRSSGKYQAAADAVLYEFDAGYRAPLAKRAAKCVLGLSLFGASLRRLRKHLRRLTPRGLWAGDHCQDCRSHRAGKGKPRSRRRRSKPSRDASKCRRKS